MKLAACYIRVSTDEQVEYSPESQLRAVRDYAAQHDYYIPDELIFRDEGISGRTVKKRPEFNRMIALAKSKPKPFEAVLLWKFSRFARNRADAIVYKRLLRDECGIDVISISENLGEDRGTALILESMFEAMDEYYSINLSTEVKRSMTMMAEKGEVVSTAPFGYRVENKRFVIEPDKAAVIRYIFDAFEQGVGQVTIARRLNEMGVKTNRGNPPDKRFVLYILHNPVYCGKIRWSKSGRKSTTLYRGTGDDDPDLIIAQGSHEPIISPEQFERVRQLLEQQKHTYAKYQHKEAPKRYALSGLVVCDSCGGHLTFAAKKNPALQCINYSHGTCHVSHHVSLNIVNAMVLQGLKQAANTLQFEVERVLPQKEKNDRAVLEKILDYETRRLEKVKEAYQLGIDTADEYRENKARALAAIEKAKAQLDAIEPAAPIDRTAFSKKILSVVDIFENPTVSDEAKNEALRSIIRRIIYTKSTRTFNIIFYAK